MSYRNLKPFVFRYVLLACLPFVSAAPAPAQTPKIPLLVSATVGQEDEVGRQVLFELKESIRGSSAFELIDSPDHRKPRSDEDSVAYMKVSFVALKDSAASTVIATSIAYDSISMPIYGALLTTTVQICGRDKTVNCARSLLRSVDEQVVVLTKNYRGFYGNLIGR